MKGVGCPADGILAINLDDRPDRWQEFLSEVEPYLDGAHLQRFPAVKGIDLDGFGKPPLFRGRKRDRTWAGRAGCALSHRGAIAYAAQAGWRSVLILEDDIVVDSRFPEVCESLEAALSVCAWDICYLGFTDPVGPFRKMSDLADGYGLYRLYGCSTTHAYLVRDTAYKRLLQLLPEQKNIWGWLTRHRAIDRWYSRSLSLQFKVMAVSPSLVDQKQGVSDITGRNQEYGHVTKIQNDTHAVLPYPLAEIMTRMKYAFLGSYDSVRGFIKRRKGF